jgi:hypothetical protein
MKLAVSIELGTTAISVYKASTIGHVGTVV